MGSGLLKSCQGWNFIVESPRTPTVTHSARFPELPKFKGAWIHQALPSSSSWKLPRQLIYSYMFSRGKWAHSQEELKWVSHSPLLLSYFQSHNAISSLVLAVMLTGPLLWQFHSLYSRKSSTSLLGLFSATSVCWSPYWVSSVLTGSGMGTTSVEHFFLMELFVSSCSETPFVGREKITPDETSAATWKQETAEDLPLSPAKPEKLNKAGVNVCW